MAPSSLTHSSVTRDGASRRRATRDGEVPVDDELAAAASAGGNRAKALASTKMMRNSRRVFWQKDTLFLILAWSLVASCRGSRDGVGLSPACDQLDAPPVLTAAPDLDLSVLTEPHTIAGLLKEPWTLPASLLADTTGRTLRVDLMPADCAEAPLKLPNGTLIGPASVKFPMADVLPLLRYRLTSLTSLPV